MMQHWTHEQWIAFYGIVTAGCAALALLGLAVRSVRGWTAPAHGAYADSTVVRRVDPRPTLALAAARGPRITDAQVLEHERRWRAAVAWDRPTEVLEHLAPGPGSLTDLAAAGPGELKRIVHADLIDPDVHAWFVEVFDRPAHTPHRDEALELDEGGALTRFRAALDPAMRKAHLWEIQGRGHAGHDSARQILDHWRAGTDTGAWPVVVPIGGQLPDESVLVSA